MATLADFRARVSAKLSMSNADGSEDQQLIDGWANEAVVDILLRTGLRVTLATSALVVGQGDYELPTASMLRAKHVDVTSSGRETKLERIGAEDLLRLRRSNPASNSPPRYYALDGGNLFRLYPIPSLADMVTWTFVPRPAPMTAGTHDPSDPAYGGVPTEFHKAIEYYALWQGGDTDDDSSSGQGERYRLLYEGNTGTGGELAKIAAAVAGKLGRRPPMRIGPPRHRRTDFLKPGQIGV